MKSFKTESKRLLELMVNSIYTNKEIFLRELISNSSDALDKLRFLALTDSKLERDFCIDLQVDKEARTLMVTDNGVGMSKEELEANLGTIAKSGTNALKQESNAPSSLIGQFGVGFYSVFMVAQRVEVKSRKYDSQEAYIWSSSGAEGYIIEPCQLEQGGTQVLLHLRKNDEDFDYDKLLDEEHISSLIKKYSDYISYPIRMEKGTYKQKEGSDGWEIVRELTTLNSRVPIWRQPKSKVSEEELGEFYKNRFYDTEPPLKSISANIEGILSYNALIFIPKKAPKDFFSKEFQKGLLLYSNSVFIQNCAELLPDYLSFLKGVVDTPDVSLNISREMLQQDRQLKGIAASLEKRVLAELAKMLKNERNLYEQMFDEFGLCLKAGVYSNYGADSQKLKDLLLFKHSGSQQYTTLAELVEALPKEQEHILYAAGASLDVVKKMPQVQAVCAKGLCTLYLTDPIDEFIIKILESYGGKEFKSVTSKDLELGSEQEKEEIKKATEDNSQVLSRIKDILKGKVTDVILSNSAGSFPACIRADGDISLEMEKVLNAMPGAHQFKTRRILEINPYHPLFEKLKSGERMEQYARYLYEQALVLANVPLEDNVAFIELVNQLL